MRFIKELFLLLTLTFPTLYVVAQDGDPETIERTPEARVIESAEVYIAAFNHPDEAIRKKMFAKSFHENGKVVMPNEELDLNGLYNLATGFQKAYKMEIIGLVKIHHNYLTFHWKYTAHDGNEENTGTDFCEFGSDGRLTKVIVFFDR